uniref:Chondroadherin-like protein n=1 Tax=Cacopsylla melanoneura TaxID=428564 RepID=A0A8D9A7U3_9HEMI
MTQFSSVWLLFCLLCSSIASTRSISVSCYRPNSVPTNLYQNYGEIIVDCSLHGFGSREELFFHKSDLCQTTPTLCDLITGFDYSYNAIRHLGKPRYEFPLMSKLIFQHNSISEIEDEAFSGEHLKMVDLSHNQISGLTLNKNTFRGKFNQSLGTYDDSHIEKLLLGFNEISFLTYGTFHYLKRLTVLEINNNPLSVMGTSREAFQALTNLKYLHLGSTNLSRLPDTMFSGMKIETLYLNGNQFTQVPHLKPIANTLHHLNLDNNQLRELNERSFSELRYLTTLNITANLNLYAIRKNTFNSCYNLQTFYCNFNPSLEFIHPYAFNIGWNLREFYINNNAITSLPHELGDWDSVEVLDIQSNPWTCDCSIQWMIDYVAKRQKTDPELNYNLHCAEPSKYSHAHLLSNPVLSYISHECVKNQLGIPQLSSQLFKLYPLLFIMTLLLITLVAYLVCFSYRYAKSHVPSYVCNYTVQYNRLKT